MKHQNGSLRLTIRYLVLFLSCMLFSLAGVCGAQQSDTNDGNNPELSQQLSQANDQLKQTQTELESAINETERLNDALSEGKKELETISGDLQKKTDELTQARSEIESLKAKVAELESISEALLNENKEFETVSGALEKKRDELEKVSGDLQQKSDALAQALSQIDSLKAKVAQLSSASAALKAKANRVEAVATEKETLEEQLTQTREQMAQFQNELRLVEEENFILEKAVTESNQKRLAVKESQLAKMALLQNSLAPQDGGSASLESVGPRAKDAYDQYVKLIRNKKSRSAGWEREVEKVKEALHDIQALAGRILDAKGLMMVQPGQTLSSIAYQFYGKSDWNRIYQANKHILKSPDRVDPGITLVIP